jgi:hypothetical protein
VVQRTTLATLAALPAALVSLFLALVFTSLRCFSVCPTGAEAVRYALVLAAMWTMAALLLAAAILPKRMPRAASACAAGGCALALALVGVASWVGFAPHVAVRVAVLAGASAATGGSAWKP